MSSNVYNIIGANPKEAAKNASAIALLTMVGSAKASMNYINSAYKPMLDMMHSMLANAWASGLAGVLGELVNTVGVGLSMGATFELSANSNNKQKALNSLDAHFSGIKDGHKATIQSMEESLNISENGAIVAGGDASKLKAKVAKTPEEMENQRTLLKSTSSKLEDVNATHDRKAKDVELTFQQKEYKISAFKELYQAGGQLAKAAMNGVAGVSNAETQTLSNMLSMLQGTIRDLISSVNAIAGMNFYTQLGR